MPIEQALREYCDYGQFIKGFTTDTIRRYRTNIHLFCSQTGVSHTKDITEQIVRNYFYRGRIDRNWSSGTFRTYHKSLLVFFRWCVQRKYLYENPILNLELPKKEKKLPTKLSKSDAMRLLEYVYNLPYDNRFLQFRNHAIFATFLYAGLRKGELLHLQFGDVDIENLTIFVRQGKGKKDRIIPMSHSLAAILTRYTAERTRLKKACPEFFASFNRDVGFTVSGLKHLSELIKKKSRMKFGIHMLRHTFATLMLEGGCDIYSLSKMMGHSDINTTTIYLAASAEHLRNQIVKHPLNN